MTFDNEDILKVSRADLMNEPEFSKIGHPGNPNNFKWVFSAYASTPLGKMKEGKRFSYGDKIYEINRIDTKNTTMQEFKQLLCASVESQLGD